jgi:hypothetical protein
MNFTKGFVIYELVNLRGVLVLQKANEIDNEICLETKIPVSTRAKVLETLLCYDEVF